MDMHMMPLLRRELGVPIRRETRGLWMMYRRGSQQFEIAAPITVCGVSVLDLNHVVVVIFNQGRRSDHAIGLFHNRK
jgi:hypothetical protein